jgi:hypothetical protein
MILNLSETGSGVMLDALSDLMDGASIELLSDTQHVLAILKFSTPAADAAVGGLLEFNEIAEEDAALAPGNVIAARIVTSDGREVFTCDVGGKDSDAVIKLNTTRLAEGSPVRINAFRLMLPS